MSTPGGYRADIDGLRAVAVVMVLLFHAHFLLDGGFVGVDVFFVISGFLITGIVQRELEAGRFTFSNFWLRRIRRIAPAATVMTIAVLIAGLLLLFPADYMELAQSAVAQQVMAANIFFWRHTGYFQGAADTKPLLHTWSLAVEEQFYLFYPVLLWLIHRYTRRWLLSVLGIAALGSLFLSEWGARHHAGVAFYLLPTRAWELLVGGILFAIPAPTRWPHWSRETLSAVGLALVITTGVTYFDSMRFPGFSALLPCLGAAGFIYANSVAPTICGRLLSMRPIVFTGLISYSLYLWHWPLFALHQYWYGANRSGLAVGGLLFTSYVLAVLSWRYVELPFRRRPADGRPNRSLAVIAGSIACSLAISAVVLLFDGLPARMPKEALQYASALSLRVRYDAISLDQALAGKVPQFLEGGSPNGVLIWGDSHAMHAIPGLKVACERVGLSGYYVTRTSTAPLMGNSERFTREGLNEKASDFAAALHQFVVSKPIHTVVLAACWDMYTSEPGFEARLTQTVESFVQHDVHVVIALDVPPQPDNVPLALARRSLFGLDTAAFGLPLTECLRIRQHSENIIRRVANGRALVLDPVNRFANNDGLCPAVIDGDVIYADSWHLTPAGSLRLAPMY